MKPIHLAGLALLGIAGVIIGTKKVEDITPPPDTIPVPEANPIREHVVSIARREIGDQDAEKYGPTMDNWCGNFTLWVLHQAGLAGGTQPHWAWCLDLPTTLDPQPGDIVYFGPPNNHESILVSFDDDTVTTIDGNQELVHGPGKGLVLQKTRKRSAVNSFRSIQGLIDDANTVSV